MENPFIVNVIINKLGVDGLMEGLVEVHPEKCAACLSCQLACSFRNYGFFSISKSMIKVSRLGTKVNIEFSAECKGCLECVKWCLYGALRPKKGSHK